MVIKTKMFIKFLKQTVMTGVSILNEGIINFDVDGITVTADTASTLVVISSHIKKENIQQYKPIGEIGISNFPELVKLAEGFISEKINIDVKENLLVLSSSTRKVKILLKDKEYIKKSIKYPNDTTKRDVGIVDISVFKSFFKNMNMVNASEINFVIKNNNIILKTKGLNEVIEKIQMEVLNKNVDIKITFNRALVDAVENLVGDVVINVKTNYPIEVVSNSEEIRTKILVAPVVKEME